MLLEDSFAEFGKQHILLCHITTHIKDQPHDDLLGKVGGRGFPTIAALDADGNVIGHLRGQRNVSGFEGLMSSAKETSTQLRNLAQKASKGDAAAKLELFEKKLQLKHFDFAAAQAAYKALGKVSDDVKKRIEAQLAGLEVASIFAKVKPNKKSQIAAGEKLAAMVKAGREPKGRMERLNSWFLISMWAESTKNVEMFERAYKTFKATEGIRPTFLQGLERKLKALKGGGDKSDAKKDDAKKSAAGK